MGRRQGRLSLARARQALGPQMAEEQAGKGGQEAGRLSQTGLARAQDMLLGRFSKQRKRLASHARWRGSLS